MTSTLPPFAVAPSRLKGPSHSVSRGGDWSAGLQKARIYETILLDIILGELAPMQVLDERVLAARYAAGLSGVRDSLGRLALEGLVIRRPRVGTIVAPLDIAAIEEAFEVRRLLEGRTAALAAKNATKTDVDAIRDAFADAETAVARDDTRALLIMDRNFHQAVALATGNATLARFVINLQNVATRFWIWKLREQSPEAQMDDVRLHRALADSIAAGLEAEAEVAAGRLVGDPPSLNRT
jgi:DNA-binding GntR family transcriptional regulator